MEVTGQCRPVSTDTGPTHRAEDQPPQEQHWQERRQRRGPAGSSRRNTTPGGPGPASGREGSVLGARRRPHTSHVHGRSHAASAQRAAAAPAEAPAKKASRRALGRAGGGQPGGTAVASVRTANHVYANAQTNPPPDFNKRRVKSPEHDAAHNGKERRRASGQRAAGEMAAPPPCWGAACSGGAREPWCPDHTVTPASALGSPRPRRGTGRRASQRPRAHRRTRTGQAGGHSPVCQETPHPEGAPRPAAGFALEGPPRATPRCGARMLRLHDRHAGQRRWPVRAQPPPASTFLT